MQEEHKFDFDYSKMESIETFKERIEKWILSLNMDIETHIEVEEKENTTLQHTIFVTTVYSKSDRVYTIKTLLPRLHSILASGI